MYWKPALLCCAVFVLHFVKGDGDLLLKFSAHKSSVLELHGLKKSATDDPDVFVSTYQDKYMNSTRWIWKVTAADYDKGGFLKAVKDYTNYHYERTKKYMEDALAIFDKAAQVEITFLKAQNESFHHREKQHTVWRIRILQYFKLSLDDLINSEWLPVAKQDVKELLRYQDISVRLAALLIKFLKEKYPFRTWLVYIEDVNAVNVFCAKSDYRLLQPIVLGSRLIHILHVNPVYKATTDMNTILANIRHTVTTNPFKCSKKSRDIFAEMRVTCSTFHRLSMTAGVFQIRGEWQAVSSSDAGRLQFRRIVRKFWRLCYQDYFAFIFH